MASVYLAQDRKHNRNVAIKVMRPELASTLGADRFLREVEIAAQLNHPHILAMYDSGQSEGILYYVMPYVEGESLLGRIRSERQLPVEEVLRLGREVAEALAVAHARGIIHRDIKPANVLLTGGHALVADFGIARAIGTSESITATGIAVGTPHYMSPEQATGDREVDARTDVYALGTVLYEALAGEPPFTGPTAQSILSRVLMESPRPLNVSRPGIPASVNAVIMKALARSPADRFQTASEMASALQSAATGGHPVAEPVPDNEQTSPARVLALYGLAAAVLLFVTWSLVRQVALPAWMLGLGVLLLVAGVPILLATARAEAKGPARSRTGIARWLTWRNAIAGGVLAFAGWGILASTMVLRTPGSSGSAAAGPVRLAVMPFINQGDSADAYFVDGIADQLRGKLTELGAVQVIARSSTDLYRATTKPPAEIGRELDVEYLLSATVRTVRNADGTGRVQLVPELIKAKTGSVAWSQTFDASITDLFQVQTDMAIRLAGALNVALGAKEQEHLAERPTKSLAAYDAFLKAEATRGGGGETVRNQEAVSYYEQAIALDSTFALAWSRLSQLQSRIYFSLPTPRGREAARISAERAQLVAPGSAEAHLAMGDYYNNVLADQARARAEYEQGLKVSPNFVDLQVSSAETERALGHWDTAVARIRQAIRLDPRSGRAYGSLATHLLWMRRYPEAMTAADQAIQLTPNGLAPRMGKTMIYLAQGDTIGAREVIAAASKDIPPTVVAAYFGVQWDLYWALDRQMQEVLLRLGLRGFDDDEASRASVMAAVHHLHGNLAAARAYGDSAHRLYAAQLADLPDSDYLLALDAVSLAYGGKRDEAIKAGERSVQLLPVSKDAYSGAYNLHQLIRTYLIVGEKEKALARIKDLLSNPYFISPGWLKVDPTFAPLRGDPRFEALTK
jgi:serine/threonine-protein kinase